MNTLQVFDTYKHSREKYLVLHPHHQIAQLSRERGCVIGDAEFGEYGNVIVDQRCSSKLKNHLVIAGFFPETDQFTVDSQHRGIHGIIVCS